MIYIVSLVSLLFLVLVLFVWLIKIKITCLKAIEMLREINADIDTSIENYRRHEAEADAKVQLRQGSG